MAVPIEGTLPLLLPHAPLEPRPLARSADEASGVEFDELLAGMVASANHDIARAERAGEAFAGGSLDDIHGTMLALSKADIELRFVGNVRNRVIDAFYELWRMQI